MKFNAIHIIIYTLFLALLPACELIHDDLPETKAEGAPVYIRLTISTGGEMGTKANPTGGEEGNGWEGATESENTVNDVTLFFFPISVNIDGEATTTVTSLSFTKEDLTGPFNGTDRVDKYYTVTKEVEGLTEDDYNVLAVVNVGSNTAITSVNTLGALRDLVITSPVSTADNFMMSSERLATVEDIQGTSENNPAHVDIYVERLAARVDYQVQYPTDATSFTTTDGSGTVQILGASLVNCLNTGEYLFKRVGDAADNPSSIKYLGDETADGTEDNKVATNWVVDPYSLNEKTFANPYDPTTFDKLSFIAENTETEWTFLGYTLENTNPSDADKEKYTTGVVFKAKFTPTGTDVTDADGSFYYLNGKFYKDIEAVKAAHPDMADLSETNYASHGISYYEEGICYYPWWILHSNNADGTDIMRYAIVRNNLYLLTVTSVAGLPVDGDELVVAVHKWDPLDEVTVDLDKLENNQEGQ